MKTRIIDDEIKLVAYYPNYATALEWYQDLELCKQVDNRDTAYDINLLKGMYKYLNNHGDLFYIKYKNRLCGDVCLQPNGEVNIVIAKPFQNKHIGRRVINEIIQLISGRIILLVKLVTIAVKASPTITPTARSKIFPRVINFLNSPRVVSNKRGLALTISSVRPYLVLVSVT